ncbi:MAG: hypothetical protein IPF79_06065 [Ignavibacteria bacterium]|nr:hypothetical protein [Ignavibacteria bacterium]
MNTKTFDSSNSHLRIGDVFTPTQWALFAIDEFGIYDKWLKGNRVFDPTMGSGNLLEALIIRGLSDGKRLPDLPTENLFGNELNSSHYRSAIDKFKQKYHLDMTLNFSNQDILNLKSEQYDIVFGNPPWQNFVDLPNHYKDQIKGHFFTYDLVENSQELLLGGSRIDIAALIIQISINDFLLPGGEAFFFIPLSLLLNDGANRGFRTCRIKDVHFSIEKVFDFNDEDVFNVSTRYGLCAFKRDKVNRFPIDYQRLESNTWVGHSAKPIFRVTDPLSIIAEGAESLENFP